MFAFGVRVQPVSATLLVVYRLAFRSPARRRSHQSKFTDIHWLQSKAPRATACRHLWQRESEVRRVPGGRDSKDWSFRRQRTAGWVGAAPAARQQGDRI